VLGIIVIASLGPGAYQVMIAITIAFLPRFIRVARSMTLSLKEQEFVASAKALGASDWRIMVVHILPNNISPAVIMGTLWMGSAIIIESGLSFLGLGVQPPKASWGLLIKYGVENLMWAPWNAIIPGLAISLTIIGLNVIGDTFRDMWDPRNEFKAIGGK
jgi:peptide/nickel transport system permease protein